MVAAFFPSTYRDFRGFLRCCWVLLIFRPYGILGKPQTPEGVTHDKPSDIRLSSFAGCTRWETIMGKQIGSWPVSAGRRNRDCCRSAASPSSSCSTPTYQLIMAFTLGINIILATVSLNLVNGYMGEFSVGHAGFMAVGRLRTALAADRSSCHPGCGTGHPGCSRLAILAGGLVAALIGFLIVALPSFKSTR